MISSEVINHCGEMQAEVRCEALKGGWVVDAGTSPKAPFFAESLMLSAHLLQRLCKQYNAFYKVRIRRFFCEISGLD